MKSSSDAQEELKSALRETAEKRMYERYLAVLHHMDGHTIRDIAKMIKRTEKTVSGYIHQYQEGGIEALALGHSPGKPHRLSAAQEKRLAHVIATQQPVDVGIESHYTWTLKLAVRFVEREFGKTFTEKGMSVLLHRLGFSYTKATYTLALADPDEQTEFQERTFPALKKS